MMQNKVQNKIINEKVERNNKSPVTLTPVNIAPHRSNVSLLHFLIWQQLSKEGDK